MEAIMSPFLSALIAAAYMGVVILIFRRVGGHSRGAH
jgi:hypothetical protein